MELVVLRDSTLGLTNVTVRTVLLVQTANDLKVHVRTTSLLCDYQSFRTRIACVCCFLLAVGDFMINQFVEYDMKVIKKH